MDLFFLYGDFILKWIYYQYYTGYTNWAFRLSRGLPDIPKSQCPSTYTI
jgi:hypothetical protein